jgi:hypothetical protein
MNWYNHKVTSFRGKKQFQFIHRQKYQGSHCTKNCLPYTDANYLNKDIDQAEQLAQIIFLAQTGIMKIRMITESH